MPAYAVCNLNEVHFGPEIIQYLERIDQTLTPYQGRFLIHGNPKRMLEGDWPGALIVLEFPDAHQADAWYQSPAYQLILPLRTEHSSGYACIVEGVGADYRAASKVAQLTQAGSS